MWDVSAPLSSFKAAGKGRVISSPGSFAPGPAPGAGEPGSLNRMANHGRREGMHEAFLSLQSTRTVPKGRVAEPEHPSSRYHRGPNPWPEHSAQRRVALPVPMLLLWMEALTAKRHSGPPFCSWSLLKHPPCTSLRPHHPPGAGYQQSPFHSPCASPPGPCRRRVGHPLPVTAAPSPTQSMQR